MLLACRVNCTNRVVAHFKPHRSASWCAFLTDVEGNWEYLQRYVASSRALYWKDSALELRDDTEFVFGGDSQDKGAGDIRVANALVDLKLRYPSRVHLIIGNRDANKLRFATELSEAALKNPEVVADSSYPYWVPPVHRVWPAKFLASKGVPDTAANRLRWMLKETMGADGAFERRAFELEELGKPSTEEDVVASFRNSVDPSQKGNFMLRYLQCAQLGYVFGKTLFVHGGVTLANMGRVPGETTSRTSVKGWIAALNSWVTSELVRYVKTYGQEGQSCIPRNQRAAHGLMDYCVPGGNEGATVVYTGYVEKGMPMSESKQVNDFLLSSGITTVAVGHQPVGDCPGVIRGAVTVVNGDSSYAASQRLGTRLERKWGLDHRGEHCAGEILFHRETGSVNVFGTLADGVPYEYCLGEGGDPYVGKVVGGQWIKARLKAAGLGSYLLSTPGQGYDIIHSTVSASDHRLRVLDE